MPQSRGMVKIMPRGKEGEWWDPLKDAEDWIVDFIPYFVDFYNGMIDNTNEFDSRQATDVIQNFWNYVIRGGYLFYVDDIQVTYHGKDTETFRTGDGKSTGVQTNKEVYREYKFKTVISERDFDVVSGTWSKTTQNAHSTTNGMTDVYAQDWVSGFIQDWWNASTGYNIAFQYLDKRKKFLRDLDGADLTISSSMFETADVKMTEYSYQVAAGQQETTYTLAFKEVSSLEDISGDTSANTGVDSIEPGTM